MYAVRVVVAVSLLVFVAVLAGCDDEPEVSIDVVDDAGQDVVDDVDTVTDMDADPTAELDDVIDDAWAERFAAAASCVVRTLDVGADGAVDWREFWTYDENGNMLTQDEDLRPADGEVDWREAWTYECPSD